MANRVYGYKLKKDVYDICYYLDFSKDNFDGDEFKRAVEVNGECYENSVKFHSH